jgi:hypothetical protein
MSRAPKSDRRRRNGKERLVMTSFMVTPALRRRLKIEAARRGQSLGALLRDAATQALRRKGSTR